MLIFNNICGPFQGAEKGKKKAKYEMCCSLNACNRKDAEVNRCRGTVFDTPLPPKYTLCVVAAKFFLFPSWLSFSFFSSPSVDLRPQAQAHPCWHQSGAKLCNGFIGNKRMRAYSWR